MSFYVAAYDTEALYPWWEKGERFIRIKVSTRAMHTIDKKGLQEYADEVGLDLSAY